MNISYEPPGKYYEDLKTGDVYLTVSRTVTEADVMNFCGVSGDFNQLHTDIEFARETTFQKRIAHGLCGMAIASGCLSRTGLIEGTTIAFAGIENWMFTSPIFFGDTIRVLVRVAEKKETRRKDGGLVKFDLEVQNQEREICQKGTWVLLMRKKG